MQTHGGLNAEEAIQASERRVYVELKVDWDRDGTYDHALSDLSPYVDNVVLDRNLTGSAPEEITLIEGGAAAELTWNLGGDHIGGWQWVREFSPYNGNSAFYNIGFVGAEVKYRIGIQTPLGVVWYEQFVGNIRQVTPNRQTDTVAFSALDRVELLRRPIFMTDWGVLDYQANGSPGELSTTIKTRLNGQLMKAHWVIDHALKHCNTSATPWRWPEPAESAFGKTMIYISGNSGIAPNIGWVDGSWQNQFPPDDTPALTVFQDWGQAHPLSDDPLTVGKRPQILRAQRDWGDDQNLYWAWDRDFLNDEAATSVLAFTLQLQDIAGSGWWLTAPTNTILMDYQPIEWRRVQVYIEGGWMGMRVMTTNPTTLVVSTYTAPGIDIAAAAGSADYIRCKFEYNPFSQQVRMTVGATTTGILSTGHSNWGTSFHESTGLLRLYRAVALQDIIVGAHSLGLISNPGEAGVAADYGAVLDKSLNDLSFLPDRRGAIAWDVITEVAAAEFGAVFWDEQGIFRFWNQDTLVAKKGQPVRTFNLDQVQGLQMTVTTDSIRNIISVVSKRGRVQKTIVYEAQGPDEYIAQDLPGFDPNITTLWLQNVVTPNSGRPPVYAHPDQTTGSYPVWTDFVQHGLVVQSYDNTLPGGPGWHHWSEVLPVRTFGLWMYRGPEGDTKLRYNEGYTTPQRFAIAEAFVNAYSPEGKNSAAFRWDGSKMSFFDDTTFSVTNDDSVADWGPQGLALSGDWYQEFYNRNGMLDKILERTSKPVPVTDAISVPGDPRLQLGDAVQIIDPDGFGELLQMQIFGINRTFSRDGGLVDTLTVELTDPTQIGVWDSAQYGRWDETFYWN